LRIVNAAADTPFRIAIGGHRLTVTHSDGFPVDPFEVDTLLIGMGERYDVIVAVADGAWPFIALAEGRDTSASAVLRTANTTIDTTPPPEITGQLPELAGRLLEYADLRATDAVALDFAAPDHEREVTLTGRNADFHWGIDGGAFPDNGSVDVRLDERARLLVRNTTKMWHPMHLHGHTFRLGERRDGPRKDTVVVRPGELLALDTVCDNPGQWWMLHCHNAYHLETGMAIAFRYMR
jgi:multicopper oxidase